MGGWGNPGKGKYPVTTEFNQHSVAALSFVLSMCLFDSFDSLDSPEVWAELPSLPCLPTKTFGMANLKGLDSESVRTRKRIEFGICIFPFCSFRTSAKLFGLVSL